MTTTIQKTPLYTNTGLALRDDLIVKTVNKGDVQSAATPITNAATTATQPTATTPDDQSAVHKYAGPVAGAAIGGLVGAKALHLGTVGTVVAVLAGAVAGKYIQGAIQK